MKPQPVLLLRAMSVPWAMQQQRSVSVYMVPHITPKDLVDPWSVLPPGTMLISKDRVELTPPLISCNI